MQRLVGGCGGDVGWGHGRLNGHKVNLETAPLYMGSAGTLFLYLEWSRTGVLKRGWDLSTKQPCFPQESASYPQ